MFHWLSFKNDTIKTKIHSSCFPTRSFFSNSATFYSCLINCAFTGTKCESGQTNKHFSVLTTRAKNKHPHRSAVSAASSGSIMCSGSGTGSFSKWSTGLAQCNGSNDLQQHLSESNKQSECFPSLWHGPCLGPNHSNILAKVNTPLLSKRE